MPVSRSTNLSRPQARSPRTRLEYTVPFYGTLDTTSNPAEMAEENSPDALNNIYDSVGGTGTRKGYIKLLTTKTPSWIGGMAAFYKSDGTKQLIYGSNTGLYRYNNAGGSTLITGTPGTFTANKQWTFTQYLDAIYGGNGVEPLITYNGSSYSIANGAISPQVTVLHKNRLYCVPANSSTVYYSDSGIPNSFPANNFIQANSNDGQVVTGLTELVDNLVIFKSQSAFVLTGEPIGAGNLTVTNFQVRQASSAVGCSSFRTICKVDESIFFMHSSGIYYLQNYSIYPLSVTLNATFKNDVNPNFLNLCWAVYSPLEKKYILGYPSGSSTVCNKVIVFDLITKKWAIWDDIYGNCALNYNFSGSQDTLLVGDPRVGNIYEMFQGYADIAGDNGTTTGGSSTTLVDSTKSWTSNQFVDCRVAIVTAPGVLQPVGVVTSNTLTTLTFASTTFTPSAGQQYTVGYYDSYWTSKQFDFGMTGYSKVYKFFNLFVDSETYPILYGQAVDYAPLNYQKYFNLSSSALLWGSIGLVWGPSSGVWGSSSAEFAQANIGATGRYLRIKFGNNLANQPWSSSHYSVSYKLKRQRPNIVTV